METNETVLKDITAEKMAEIKEAVNNQLAKASAALKERASEHDKAYYTKLVDYCTENVQKYMDNEENLKAVLTNPLNIEAAYAALTGTDEFKAMSEKEYGHLPRIIAMLILAGSESYAADTAMQLVETDEEKTALDALAEIYQGYVRDAAEFGKGAEKTVEGINA